MKGYKAFNANLACRGFQYEIGKTYEMDEDPVICYRGFHFCASLADCYNFYDINENTRICEVTATGKIVSDDDIKYCTNKIKIDREIENPREESNTSKTSSGYCNGGNYNKGNYNSGNNNSGNNNSGNNNSGNRNSSFCNSGDCNSGNHNSGDYNSGDYNSGDYNSGSHNSGCCNSGDYNSGYRNSGDGNSGYHNSGDHNSGDYNSGSHNSGNHNSGYCNNGDYNSGDYNNGDYNSGCFNTHTNPKIKLFNKESNWTMRDWFYSEAQTVMSHMPHTYSDFIHTSVMTDDEKENHPEYKTIGGYIKTFVATKADKQKWWDGLIEKNKNYILSLPNFDADIFYQCTEIRVNETAVDGAEKEVEK